MRPIAEATARITGQSCSRKYIALGRILSAWAEIVGPDLAQKAQPAKLRYISRDKSKTPVAILEIATSTADATLLHYQKDLILERINQIFGAGWITGIRFVSSAANAPAKPRSKPRKPMTAEEKTYLSDTLETIEDPAIKERLASLGEAIMTKSKENGLRT